MTVLFVLGVWNRNTIPGLQRQPWESQNRNHKAQKPMYESAAVKEEEIPPRGLLFGNSMCAVLNRETPYYGAGAFDGDNRLSAFIIFHLDRTSLPVCITRLTRTFTPPLEGLVVSAKTSGT